MSGNQHGYHCPECGRDDRLWLSCTVRIQQAQLRPNDLDHDGFGDSEWEDDDAAGCYSCDWEGRVGGFEVREAEEEQMTIINVQLRDEDGDPLSNRLIPVDLKELKRQIELGSKVSAHLNAEDYQHFLGLVVLAEEIVRLAEVTNEL